MNIVIGNMIKKSLIIGIIVITSSCGINKGLSIEQVNQRDKIDCELDKLYLNYSYKIDSLIMEFYQIKPTKNCCEKTAEGVYKYEGEYINEDK